MDKERNKQTEEAWVAFLAGEAGEKPDLDPLQQQEADALRQTWDLAGSAFVRKHTDPDKAWATVQQAMEEKRTAPVLRRLHLFRYAAAVVLLLGTIGVIRMVTKREDTGIQTIASAKETQWKSTQTVAHPTHYTTLTLSDGTVVKLNANSTIEYPEQFAANERVVKLSGEAFFEVVHNTAQPFKVLMEKAVVEDIGTSFHIAAYPGKDKVVVNVTSGSVRLMDRSGHETAVLMAGSSGKWNRSTGKIDVSSELVPNYLSWVTQQITFRHTPLSSVFEQLEDVYHVSIAFSDPAIGQIAYTANFEKFELNDILNIIARTHHLTVEQVPEGYLFHQQ
ncbi:MAG: FecR domain-containing protein [Marinilabiliales bacterium]|nr:FecR domain-containing protein [Marinilabiliales bacterium]